MFISHVVTFRYLIRIIQEEKNVSFPYLKFCFVLCLVAYFLISSSIGRFLSFTSFNSFVFICFLESQDADKSAFVLVMQCAFNSCSECMIASTEEIRRSSFN
ncbi:CLUMA_CG002976, isoform A [Clunio marinus]|uniref:CLUMA_CG002976, isoform A n=1 Tax=Clunio marinus TaxID=568069 RepID=A0A1J1HSP4_9DIPT|nr:CLUMA_CG002976, isoform A [Clunio marinus]